MRIVTFVASIFLLSTQLLSQDKSLTQYVNPFIGAQGRGNLHPGATVPFGLVQVGPDNSEDGELSSGYQYNFNYIHGFSHTHLSGTGIGDMTDLLIMPTIGKLHVNYDPKNISGKGYQSKIDVSSQQAKPGYYSVKLKDYGVAVELSATERCGFHKYKFPASDSAHIIFDLKYLNTQKKTPSILESQINIINDSVITGYRLVSNWAPNRYFFFAIKFSKPFSKSGVAINDTLYKDLSNANGKNLKAWVDFKTSKNEIIYVKVGTSAVSVEGALKNMQAEIPTWDFDKTVSDADVKWNHELLKFYAETSDKNVKEMYYTSLYRTMFAPVLYNDVDGLYRGSDNKIHKGRHTNYHIFSLWDTFRALHPLMTIMQPDKLQDMINSMLAIYDESGYLPVWHFGSGDNNCMIGFHSMPVIADAYLKGIGGFDAEKALNALIHDIHGNGNLTGAENYKHAAGGVFKRDAAIYGAKLFHQYGFIPGDMANAAVSRTLEYSLNNYNVYQMARALNKDTASYYLKCSNYYKNIYDAGTGFFRGKYRNGVFRQVAFDPVKQDWGWNVGDDHGDYVEGSGWQWLWFVPHNISGLVEIMGGKDSVINRLDKYFDPSQKGEETEEASGYIGQHAQGNEPGHHTPYLYNYVGQPWKTQKIVRDLMKETYKPEPEGLSGNDDCGQMSAWYVFSALGFYPVNPSGGLYVFGSPAVSYASLVVNEDKKFEIKTKNYSPQNIYIQKVNFNGKQYNKTWISHKDIMNGGVLEFEMGRKPNMKYGTKAEFCPPDSVYP